MIKTIIKMDEDKIITDNAYSVEHVYDVLDNASTWLLCNSDDVEDPNDFSVEDLLHYDRSRITAGAY